ncbi:hypothetical protein SCWH03_00180 [Streptomyces pacificus]|uniref:Uncharacterized protein n=1 Tax=Streptomyces pacificus TaxID=2705029 RepID=A0A6A0ALM1_9ACTN|nr:hypothetical protein SCWH03_00180 [Streptomyces pacificus]
MRSWGRTPGGVRPHDRSAGCDELRRGIGGDRAQAGFAGTEDRRGRSPHGVVKAVGGAIPRDGAGRADGARWAVTGTGPPRPPGAAPDGPGAPGCARVQTGA